MPCSRAFLTSRWPCSRWAHRRERPFIDGLGSGVPVTFFGNGDSEDQYLFGDWNADGFDDVAVRRGNQIQMDLDGDGATDIVQTFGDGNSEDQYLVGRWVRDIDGRARSRIAVRRGNTIIMSFDLDRNGDGLDDIAVRRGNTILWRVSRTSGDAEIVDVLGNGNSEDEYLVGDWDGDGRADLAVRRGNVILMDADHDGAADQTEVFAGGNSETP